MQYNVLRRLIVEGHISVNWVTYFWGVLPDTTEHWVLPCVLKRHSTQQGSAGIERKLNRRTTICSVPVIAWKYTLCVSSNGAGSRWESVTSAEHMNARSRNVRRPANGDMEIQLWRNSRHIARILRPPQPMVLEVLHDEQLHPYHCSRSEHISRRSALADGILRMVTSTQGWALVS